MPSMPTQLKSIRTNAKSTKLNPGQNQIRKNDRNQCSIIRNHAYVLPDSISFSIPSSAAYIIVAIMAQAVMDAKFKEEIEKRIGPGHKRCCFCDCLIEPTCSSVGYQPCVTNVDGTLYFYHYNCLSKVEQDGRAASKRRAEENPLDYFYFTKCRRKT